MAKANQTQVVSFPMAEVWGVAEQTMSNKVDSLTGLKTTLVEQEETLAYVSSDADRLAVINGSAEAAKSITAVCLSIVADVIDSTPHIANCALETKAWKGAFAKVEDQYFNETTPHIWQVVKSTVKRWLKEDAQALTGDRILKTTDGSLNSLRFIKTLTPKKPAVRTTVAEKVMEAVEKSEDLTVLDVVTQLLPQIHDDAALLDAVIESFGGEAQLRMLLARRIKARRADAKGHLALAA